MNTNKYRYVTCSKEPDCDIVFSFFAENLKIDLAIAKELVANRLDFTENKNHYVLIDFTNVQQITLEAKNYMQTPEAGLKNILGAALFASNPISVLMANIFLKAQTEFPKRFFTDKTEAHNWLTELENNTTFQKQ
jgi:hypothetical protein